MLFGSPLVTESTGGLPLFEGVLLSLVTAMGGFGSKDLMNLGLNTKWLSAVNGIHQTQKSALVESHKPRRQPRQGE